MAIEMVPIPASKGGRIPLDKIGPDVVEAVESAFTFCQGDPSRLQAAFATKAGAEEFLHEARSYAYQRPAGRVVVTGNPAGKDGVNACARFRVEPFTSDASAGTSDA